MAPLKSPRAFSDGIAQLLDGTSSGLIFKHSPYCSLSAVALQHVSAFAKAHPEVPVLLIDVIRQRDLSNQVEEALALVHHSPQVILMNDGRRVWSASHRGVNEEAIALAVSTAGDSPPSGRARI